MIIFLTGSHGTGKTSIAKTYAERTGMNFFGSRATEAHASLGFVASDQLDFRDRLHVQTTILSLWLEQFEVAKQVGGIFDRCPIDFASYTMADVPRDLDSRVSIVVEDYLNCCIGIAKTLSNMFLCTPHGEAMAERGSGKPDVGNNSFTRHIQTIIVGILNEAEIDHSIVGAGQVSQRVDYIGRVLSSAFDESAIKTGRPKCQPRKML